MQYDELVALTYECVLDEGAWVRLLASLASATGRAHSTILFWNSKTGEMPRIDVGHCPIDAVAAYNTYYATLDPCRNFMAPRRAGHWYHDVEEFGARRIAGDQFYQDFMRPYGMGGISCIKLYELDNRGAYLSLLSAINAAVPGQEQQQLLQRLSRHLVMAGRLFEHVQQLELGIGKRDLLLNQHRTPLWLVDAQGQLFFCNHAAEQHLREPAFPLYLRQNQLLARQSASVLRAMIQVAGGKQGPARAGWLRLSDNGCRELLITPVNAETRFNLPFQKPLVMVALLENRPRMQLLVDLFRLTSAEIRLAELIAQGLPPEECAARLGISINTVRTQLRSLFRKTETERQVELVGLFARLGA